MIITELLEGQGLGNQLWVYTACRSIAKRHNYDFYIQGKGRFKGQEFLDLSFGVSDESFQQSLSQASRPLAAFSERIFYDQELGYFSSNFDERAMALQPFTKISGLFQSEEYFSNDICHLGEYVRLRDEYINREPIGEDVCVLNLRGGEYKRHKNLLLPESYWQSAMENMRRSSSVDKFICVTDDRRFANALFPGMPVISDSIADCYVALYQARHVILSNSSFAYFPVTTGITKRNVIAPMYWARFGNKLDRWASPANFYAGWHWQDANGVIFDSKTALEIRNRTVELYQQHFHYLVPASLVKQRSLRHFVPRGVRNTVKRALAPLFPKHFG